MRIWFVLLNLLATAELLKAQKSPPDPDVVAVQYTDDGFNLTGFVSIPDSATQSSKVPAVVIIPDWDGVNTYEQQRATMIAKELNYVGFAADIFGNGTAGTVVPQELRINYTLKYRNQEPELFMQRISAAVKTVAAMPEVDASKIALAGYCFGGSGVLMYALDGGTENDDVRAVVSFHGGLGDHIWNYRNETGPEVNSVRPRVLVLSGGSDDMATDIMTLEGTLNNANATWEITRYSGVQHGFTVFGGNAYNEWVDQRSWESMKQFLSEAFGKITFSGSPPAEIQVEAVPYVDSTDGKQLQGYLAKPSNEWKKPSPAVVIIPNWDGVNDYEKQRATLFAEEGYVAFAADIYGADLQENLDMATRGAQATLYRSNNTELFVSRMQRAVDLVKTYDFVDPNNIAILGYCFGGTGVVQYAFTGRDDVKVVAAFHGNVQQQFLPNENTTIVPYTMILSGGEDDAHGNQTILEQYLNGNQAQWEISRYSGVYHGFTEWKGDSYNLNADIRSVTAMKTAMVERMVAPNRTQEGGGSGNGGGGDSGYGGSGASTPSLALVSLVTTLFLIVINM